MSKNFNKVKNYYNKHLWTKKMVWNAVNRWITAEEYKQITGEEYVPEE